MNHCTEGAVRLVFDRLEKRMGAYEIALETSMSGNQRSSIYYCDPMQSGQKGGLEQAHTMLRMVLPKGSRFDFLTQ